MFRTPAFWQAAQTTTKRSTRKFPSGFQVRVIEIPFPEIFPNGFAKSEVSGFEILLMFFEHLSAPINLPVKLVEYQISVGRKVVAESRLKLLGFKQNNIGLLTVHLKHQGAIVFKGQRKAALIFELSCASNGLHDYLREQIDAVLPCTVELAGESQALKIGQQTCFDEE